LSKFLGLNSVALFEIGIKIRGQINGIITKSLYPLYPYIAQSSINNRLHQKINDFSEKIQLFVIPISIILMFTLTILLKIWLGKNNIEQISIFVITMSSTLVILLPPVTLIYQYLLAKDLAEKAIWIQVCSVVVNAIFFFTFLRKFGIYSILISNSFAYFSSFLLSNYYKFKYLNFKFYSLKYYFKIFFFVLFSLAICISIRYFLPVSLLDLVIFPFVVIIFFLIFLKRFKIISLNNDNYFINNSVRLNKFLSFIFG
jgi:O-antigen/teichoic acid export membrane protein